MKKLTFTNFKQLRRKFLNENSKRDHVVIEGNGPVLLSAPHGVSQLRLGKNKVPEIGSLSTALYLQQCSDCFLIAKTKCNDDDANFDETSEYKNTVRNLVATHSIRYLIDFHGLGVHRDCDVNLGTHIGKNVKNEEQQFDRLHDTLTKGGFKVSIDQPFMGGANTISGSLKNEFNDLWTIQIEINCAITNKIENFEKCLKLLDILNYWINGLK